MECPPSMPWIVIGTQNFKMSIGHSLMSGDEEDFELMDINSFGLSTHCQQQC